MFPRRTVAGRDIALAIVAPASVRTPGNPKAACFVVSQEDQHHRRCVSVKQERECYRPYVTRVNRKDEPLGGHRVENHSDGCAEVRALRGHQGIF